MDPVVWFTVALYVHLMAVVAALLAAGCLRMGEARLRHTASTALPWAGAVLLATGGAMTQMASGWRAPWVEVSLGAWLAIELLSILGSRSALGNWAPAVLPALVLSVATVMVVKPGIEAGYGIVLAAAAVGFGAGWRTPAFGWSTARRNSS